MNRRIAAVQVEWSDGRRYSLKTIFIERLFRGRNPLSEYLSLVFSPDADGSGWTEIDDQGRPIAKPSQRDSGTESGKAMCQ